MWRRRFCTTTAALNNKKWDALVIGGGHNGLIAAAYLAQSGLSVAVLERRHLIGGAAITEELIPGFKFSRCSYLQSLLRPSIIRDLELGRHGLKLLKRSPSSFTPCLDGRYLLLGPDAELNHSEISKFSKRDADAYPRYENQLENFCKFMDPLIDSSPPETHQGVSSFNARLKHKLQKSEFWAHCLHQSVSMGQQGLVDFMDLLLSPASKVLNNWFESEVLKATLATDAVIGATASAHTPGSGYVLLHHVMGETDGDRGIWSYVEGGMGSVSLAIGNAAKEAGATIVINAEVSKLMIEDSGTVTGVILADGTQVHSKVVLSNATPYKTFMELVPESALPDDFSHAVKHSDYSSATTKINLAVDKLPQFKCCNLGHPEAGPQHMGTIHICSESVEEIDSACQDAKNGLPSRRPIMEMTIPSVLDKTISPPGKHVINLFVQFTPYKPNDGSWEDPAYRTLENKRTCASEIASDFPLTDSPSIGASKGTLSLSADSDTESYLLERGAEALPLTQGNITYLTQPPTSQSTVVMESFAQRCFKLIDEYAPGFSSSVIGYDMLAPPDLEKIIGLTGGNIFHGAMGLDSLFLMRPVKGWSNYRTPLRGLYLCGSGAHPGGGVMGAPGRNAARVVIDDIKG